MALSLDRFTAKRLGLKALGCRLRLPWVQI